GRLSFAFLEDVPYHRFGVPSDRTYRQVSQDTGISLEVLRESMEAMGFTWISPDDPLRDDELEVVPLVDQAVSSGILDRTWMTRVGRAYAEGLRLAARVENEAYQARFEETVLAAGLGQRAGVEQACPGLWLPPPGRSTPPHRGARRPGGGRARRDRGRAGRADRPGPRRHPGQVAGRRGHAPLSRPGRGGGRGPGGGRATAGGRAAPGPCGGGRGPGGGPGGRLLRPHGQPRGPAGGPRP